MITSNRKSSPQQEVNEDLLDNLNQWKNESELVRLTFKALSDVIKQQGHQIELLRGEIDLKADVQDIQLMLQQKPDFSEVYELLEDKANKVQVAEALTLKANKLDLDNHAAEIQTEMSQIYKRCDKGVNRFDVDLNAQFKEVENWLNMLKQEIEIVKDYQFKVEKICQDNMHGFEKDLHSQFDQKLENKCEGFSSAWKKFSGEFVKIKTILNDFKPKLPDKQFRDIKESILDEVYNELDDFKNNVIRVTRREFDLNRRTTELIARSTPDPMNPIRSGASTQRNQRNDSSPLRRRPSPNPLKHYR